MNPTEKIAAIQGVLGVKVDGVWGPQSQGALDSLSDPSGVTHSVKASSFADPKDVEQFKKYYAKFKADGWSDEAATKEAFKFGDNAVGYYGDDTAGATPCCALHKSHIIARWGSLVAGKHKLVEVAVEDKSVTCVLKDICTYPDRIDLNPGACAALGLKPPAMVSATWKWAS